jgi:hypothetical protein
LLLVVQGPIHGKSFLAITLALEQLPRCLIVAADPIDFLIEAGCGQRLLASSQRVKLKLRSLLLRGLHREIY